MDWNDKDEVWSAIFVATHAEKYGQLELHGKALKNSGYNPDEIEAMIDCERSAFEAAKKLLFPYLREFLGLVTPEQAKEEARPYVDEHNRSLEMFAEVSKRPEKPAATV